MIDVHGYPKYALDLGFAVGRIALQHERTKSYSCARASNGALRLNNWTDSSYSGRVLESIRMLLVWKSMAKLDYVTFHLLMQWNYSLG